MSSLPQTVIVTHDQALPNESNLTDIHAKQETEKIFSNKKRKKISDNLDEEEINNL